MTTEAPVDEVNARIEKVLRRIATIAGELQRPQLAAQVEHERECLRTGRSTATVIVAGEASRGKSALINALLGSPGLLPVELEVTTNTHVLVRHDEEGFARVLSGKESIDIDAGELAEWASEAGNPGNVKGVGGVEVGGPFPLLEGGMALLDTPGVGGLSGEHGQLTLAALSVADALVFVVDSGAPISRPELSFLERAGRRMTTIVLAVTKIDRFAGWRQIVDDDREALAGVPLLARVPVVPVSSRLKSKADQVQLDNAEVAAELYEESNIAQLEQWLCQQVVARGRQLRAGNSLNVASGVIERLLADGHQLSTMLSEARGEPSRQAREGVQELVQSAATTMAELGEQLQLLGLDLRAQLTRALNDVRQRAETLITSSSPDAMDDAVTAVYADLVAVASTLNLELITRVEEVSRRMAEQAGVKTFEVEVEALAAPDLQREAVPGAKGAGGVVGTSAIEAVGVATSGFALQNMAGALFGGTLGVVAMPLGATAALVVAGLRRRQAKRFRSQQEARVHVGQLFSVAQADLQPALERQLVALRRRFERTVRTALDARVAEARAVVAEGERLQAASKQAQDRWLAAFRGASDSLRALAEEVRLLRASAQGIGGAVPQA